MAEQDLVLAPSEFEGEVGTTVGGRVAFAGKVEPAGEPQLSAPQHQPLVDISDLKRVTDEPLTASAPSATHSPVKQSEPDTSEDTWMRRIRRRSIGVATIKRSADYIDLMVTRSTQNEDDPSDGILTPDPEDRSLSKRAWESSMQEWRDVLRMRLGQPSGRRGHGLDAL